ncbi:MAG: hypothetical protein NG737_03870, partial [Omnitrophica bacterium]|nr:hypothetical protein [Candidatus Omnitrophota bacterium]
MLIKFKKSQATAEYAILFALVVAAAMGVQTYVKRSLQSAIKQRADWFVRTVVDGETTVVQWEAQDGTKNTHFQNSERIYTEDPEQDEPFHYEENT